MLLWRRAKRVWNDDRTGNSPTRVSPATKFLRSSGWAVLFPNAPLNVIEGFESQKGPRAQKCVAKQTKKNCYLLGKLQ